jgi:hypothetical protein
MSRRRFLVASAAAGVAPFLRPVCAASAGLEDAARIGAEEADQRSEYIADCIHAWPHETVGTAYNAYFVGTPFGPVETGPGARPHWLLGRQVHCRRATPDNCSRFGPSAQRVDAASFVVSWMKIRRDVYGRTYTVVSNLVSGCC